MRIALTLGSDAPKVEENDYIRALIEAGFRREEIVVVKPGEMPEGRFDGVVLAGGLDVEPSLYGVEEPHPTVEVDPGRDTTELAVFDAARRDGVPALGICRGMQLINVAMGGTLHQDIPSEHPSDVTHDVKGKHPTRRDHPVFVKPGTRLSEIAQAKELQVNSRHHQAVEKLAPGVAVAATAPDGLVEAFEAQQPWLLAVQWHPENLRTDGPSKRIFEEFARAVREKAKGIRQSTPALTPVPSN